MSVSPSRLKGSYGEYLAHKTHWYRQTKDKWGRRGGQRLGQYVWNQMGKDGLAWPELFYCESVDKVDDLVYNEFTRNVRSTP
jgi:hypothetical protein